MISAIVEMQDRQREHAEDNRLRGLFSVGGQDCPTYAVYNVILT